MKRLKSLVPRPPTVVAMVGVVLAAILYVQLYADRQSAGRVIGVEVDEEKDVLVIKAVVPGLAAERGGIRAGDALLAIEGHVLTRLADYDVVAAAFQPRKPVAYTVRRGTDTLTLEVTPGRPYHWWPFLLNVLTLLAYFGVGAVAYVQKNDDLRARLLFAFGLAVALEMALPQAGVVGMPMIALVAGSLFFLVSGVQIGLELHLASVIPEPASWLQRRPWIATVGYCVGGLLGLLPALGVANESLGGSPWLPWSGEALQVFFFNGVMPFWAFGVFALLATQALRFAEPQGRQQAALVLVGVAPWVVVVAWTTVLDLARLPRPQWLDVVSSLVILLYPVAIFIAMFRYHLFDIELLVKRGLLYGSMTGALVLLFWIGLAFSGALVSSLFPESGHPIWAISGATLVLGLVFAPLRHWLQRVIDRRFFPERLALRKKVIALAGELAAFGKLPLMARHLADRLCDALSVSSVVVLVADPRSSVLVSLASSSGSAVTDETPLLLDPDDRGLRYLKRKRTPVSVRLIAWRSPALAQQLAQTGAEVLVPLLSAHHFVGVLLLSGKSGGARFPAEEIELLDLFSHHVATVFENARLFESATYEGLTGLRRREAILEQLEREVARARRYQRPLTIGMVDLDEFKVVNERWGHLAGDTVLKRVAQTLSSGLRSSDLIGRYGGDEFLFLLPETDLAGAIAVADKVRALVEGMRVPMGGNANAQSTVSIGLCTLESISSEAASQTEALIQEADRNLFHAKIGRNCVVPAGVNVA